MSFGDWTDKFLDTHTMQYCSAIEMKKQLVHSNRDEFHWHYAE